MILEIPTTNALPRYTQRTTLDGVDYVLLFDWNERDGHWSLSLYDAAESPIVVGIKLVHNWPLLRGVTDSRRPQGQLYALDTTGANEDPTLETLGASARLYYFDTATVKAGA